MPRIKIDDIEYNTEDLTEKGEAQLRSLQFVQSQINRIQQEIAVYRTTQAVYLNALKAEIEAAGIKPVSAPDETAATE